ncbi:MAG: hypothetical protein AAF438_13220 [Pseudomonadota bacterium]
MSKNVVIFVLIGLLAVSQFFLWRATGSTATSEPEAEPELAAYMGDMQRYLHKLQLAIRAGNVEVAKFYLHELEEVSGEVIDNVGTYEGYAIGSLTQQMLMPEIERLEGSIQSGDEAIDSVDRMMGVCNACHVATDHDFIVIDWPRENPYNQRF